MNSSSRKESDVTDPDSSKVSHPSSCLPDHLHHLPQLGPGAAGMIPKEESPESAKVSHPSYCLPDHLHHLLQLGPGAAGRIPKVESPVSSKVRHPSSCLPDPTEVSLCILLIIPPLFPQTSPGVRPCQGICGRVEGGPGETGDCWSVLLFKPFCPLCPSCACLASHSCHTLPSCQVLQYGCGGGAVLLGRSGQSGLPSHSPTPSSFSCLLLLSLSFFFFFFFCFSLNSHSPHHLHPYHRTRACPARPSTMTTRPSTRMTR